MILTRLGPEAPFYRALTPSWAHLPGEWGRCKHASNVDQFFGDRGTINPLVTAPVGVQSGRRLTTEAKTNAICTGGVGNRKAPALNSNTSFEIRSTAQAPVQLKSAMELTDREPLCVGTEEGNGNKGFSTSITPVKR